MDRVSAVKLIRWLSVRVRAFHGALDARDASRF